LIVDGAYAGLSVGFPVFRFTEPAGSLDAAVRFRCGLRASRSQPTSSSTSGGS
jgi:hypothetical protein